MQQIAAKFCHVGLLQLELKRSSSRIISLGYKSHFLKKIGGGGGGGMSPQPSDFYGSVILRHISVILDLI